MREERKENKYALLKMLIFLAVVLGLATGAISMAISPYIPIMIKI